MTLQYKNKAIWKRVECFRNRGLSASLDLQGLCVRGSTPDGGMHDSAPTQLIKQKSKDEGGHLIAKACKQRSRKVGFSKMSGYFRRLL